jgi:hypothetical protein
MKQAAAIGLLSRSNRVIMQSPSGGPWGGVTGRHKMSGRSLPSAAVAGVAAQGQERRRL